MRRSTRARMPPLEYWRGESKVYGRAHESECGTAHAAAGSPHTRAAPYPAIQQGSSRSVLPVCPGVLVLTPAPLWPSCPPPAALPTVEDIHHRTPNPLWPQPTDKAAREKKRARTKPGAAVSSR